jgi:hypothetical protein
MKSTNDIISDIISKGLKWEIYFNNGPAPFLCISLFPWIPAHIPTDILSYSTDSKNFEGASFMRIIRTPPPHFTPITTLKLDLLDKPQLLVSEHFLEASFITIHVLHTCIIMFQLTLILISVRQSLTDALINSMD